MTDWTRIGRHDVRLRIDYRGEPVIAVDINGGEYEVDFTRDDLVAMLQMLEPR